MEYTHKIILYVEDDIDDREFLSDAIREINPEMEVVFAENGLKAIDYLNKAKNTYSTLPCLIILDINLPYLDGKETFQRIKSDLELQHIPVIVFTSSGNPNDKVLFNHSGVECITKPNNISFMNSIANRMINMCSC